MTTAIELAIGEVAEATGVSASVLRYYDEFGLIEPVRRVGGQRRFDTAVVPRVAFVRRAQEAGFSLDDIKTLLDGTGGEWPQMLARHIDELRERRAHLDDVIARLERAQSCSCQVVAECSRSSW